MITCAVVVAAMSMGLGGATGDEPERGGWKPANPRLLTRWAKDVNPEAPWPEYPRPTMVRDRWVNLNGLWDLEIAGKDGKRVEGVSPKILVPFPVESSLSGVGRELAPDEVMTCGRAFAVPKEWAGERILMHFGAVDWHAIVRVNGSVLGEHKGGFDPFTVDVTDAVWMEKENVLKVEVRDPTDTGGQPRGKQWLKPREIWYTRTSGIWQTVWMEPVGRFHAIRGLIVRGSADKGGIEADVSVDGAGAGIGVDDPTPAEFVRDWVEVEVFAGERSVGKRIVEMKDGRARVAVEPSVKEAWSPERPFLYDVRVRYGKAEANANLEAADVAIRRRGEGTLPLDEVRSYAALRDVAIGKDERGINRLMLNGKPVFQYGPLDQGFWPDGLYTPPTDEAMRFDIEAAKRMGCNMLRKHVKVESERFYTWCDKIGILVWQDMPSPFFGKGGEGELPAISDDWKKNFELELEAMVSSRVNHPSIVMWVPFNEGWGQNDIDWCRGVAERLMERDPTRLVNNATGWTDMGVGHTVDIHAYPGPAMPRVEEKRAAVLGEFGGLGLPIEGHTWVNKDNWGYVSYKSKEELTEAYIGLLKQMPVLIGEGLAAAVYTQTTDVEIECNGWLTYDREVWKIDPEKVASATAALYGPPPTVKWVAMNAQKAKVVWRYTTEKPAEGWEKPGFDGSRWKEGFGGFGTMQTPGAIIGTEWTGSDIWIRREFEAPEGGWKSPALSMHHDEDAEVYVNGVKVLEVKGWTDGYRIFPLDAKGVAAFKSGKNVMAIHCRQTRGGQCVDCGVVEVGVGEE